MSDEIHPEIAQGVSDLSNMFNPKRLVVSQDRSAKDHTEQKKEKTT